MCVHYKLLLTSNIHSTSKSITLALQVKATTSADEAVLVLGFSRYSGPARVPVILNHRCITHTRTLPSIHVMPIVVSKHLHSLIPHSPLYSVPFFFFDIIKCIIMNNAESMDSKSWNYDQPKAKREVQGRVVDADLLIPKNAAVTTMCSPALHQQLIK